MLFDVLSMGVTSVGLCSGDDGDIQPRIELNNSIIELLPISQIFDEFRYIHRRDFIEESFAKDADFLISLHYLSFKESQKNRSLYAKILCELPVVRGIASPALYQLSLSFYSGMRPWQRESIIFPRCLLYWISKEKVDNGSSVDQNVCIKHFLYSSCSALNYYSRLMFNGGNFGMQKNEATLFVRQVIENLEQFTPIINHNLSAQIAKLSFFINCWQKIVVEPIHSENVANQKNGKYIFNGIWWLGRELEDNFNQLSEQHLVNMINSLQEII
jgi:hypothetical protein